MERTDRQERADREELQRIAANVRRRRKDREWTQEDLAEHAGIDEKQVQRIEAGRINIGVRSLLRVARALEVSLGDLTIAPGYDGEAEPSAPALVAAEHVPKRPRRARRKR
jgi:transcriptional regulator with XRE-family HTH domain